LPESKTLRIDSAQTRRDDLIAYYDIRATHDELELESVSADSTQDTTRTTALHEGVDRTLTIQKQHRFGGMVRGRRDDADYTVGRYHGIAGCDTVL
jgi:hypothetical protein